MRTIKFNSVEFELASKPNILADRFQATLIKGDATMEQILNEVEKASTITTYEDGLATGVYNGYSKLLAMTVLGALNDGQAMKVSIELENISLQKQVSQLHDVVAKLQERSASQSNEIGDINGQVAALESTQSATLEDLGAELSNIAETQDTLSKAIEDLGSVLDEMVNKTESEDAE